ncbi:hypothetical protein GCM10027345_35120 [Hymenobacter daeguensis]
MTGGAAANRLALLAVGWRLHAPNKKATDSPTGQNRRIRIELQGKYGHDNGRNATPPQVCFE